MCNDGLNLIKRDQSAAVDSMPLSKLYTWVGSEVSLHFRVSHKVEHRNILEDRIGMWDKGSPQRVSLGDTPPGGIESPGRVSGLRLY